MGRSMQCLVPPFFLLISLVETTVAQRMVYPQAAVGPIAGQEFRIELRLGNRHSDQAWTGKVSFLRQQDLGRMIDLRVEESDGSSQLLAEGSWQVEIAADSSAFYRISSPSLQVGALVIESETGGIENLVTSFYYLLYDPTVQAVTDLIAVQPSTSAALAYSSMISQADNLSVGVAIVAEQGISAALSAGEDLPGVDIGLSVSLENGKKYSAVATLGGGEDGQKALFPDQVIPALPPVFDSARLDVTASSPVYLTLLGVGTPPTFQDVQIGAAPAQATSGTDGGETKDPTGGWDLMTTPLRRK